MPNYHSDWAIVSLILSIANAIISISIDHVGTNLGKWLMTNIFCLKFVSILPECKKFKIVTFLLMTYIFCLKFVFILPECNKLKIVNF